MTLKNLIHFVPSFLVAAIIAYLSLLRQVSLSLPHFFGWDKLVHFLMFFALSSVILFDTRRTAKISRKIIFVIFLTGTLYGGIIEILQEYFFYPRTGEWFDWLADSLGVIFGIISVLALWKILKKDVMS